MKHNIKKFLCFTISIIMIFIFVSCNNGKNRTLDFISTSFIGVNKLTSQGLDKNKIVRSHEKDFKYEPCYISLVDNKLIIENTFNITDNIMSLDSGYLVGIDVGEYSGGVVFVSYQGTFLKFSEQISQYKIIIEENFFKFEEINKRTQVYLITTILGFDGALYKLESVGQDCKSTKILDFEGRPQASIIYNDILYIVTERGILKIENDTFVENLIDDSELWYDLYPNSVVALDGSLYIGMNMGVYEYNLQTKEQFWYSMDFS